MTTITQVTGKTEKEITELYTNTIEMLVRSGMQYPEARQTVRELFKETLGL